MSTTYSTIRWFCVALGVTILMVLSIDMAEWVARNGWVQDGVCVNHFGEPFETTVWYAVGRSFVNPMAWFGIAVIFFLVACICASLQNRFTKCKQALAVPSTRS